MKKILRIVIFALLTPFFFTSCNKSEPIIPPIVGDVSLLTYDTMTVDYQLPNIDNYQNDLLEVTSSDTSLFTIKDVYKNKNKVVIESNLKNKVGEAYINFTYDNVLLDYHINVAVNYPTTMDEAVNAFSLACIKLPANTKFDLLLNFNNQLSLDDFDSSLEIYGWRGIIQYYGYETGVSKQIGFEVNTDASYGTIASDMNPDYQYNIPSFNYLSRSVHNEDYIPQTFYIDTVEKTLNVKNSEELFWSVEHGYRPILPTGNINLNAIYETAKDVCYTINPSWSNLIKFRELFDYLVSNTHYDYGDYIKSFGNDIMSYYLEGVFLDEGKGIAVCDGFAKAYALLCGILGLPCFRSYGFPPGEHTGHAWNYVKLDDNKWYLVCPTWAKNSFNLDDDDEDMRAMAEFYEKNISLTSYDSFLASKNYFSTFGANYSDLAWPSIKRSDTPYSGTVDEINYRIANDQDAYNIRYRLQGKTSLLNESCLYIEFNENVSSSNFTRWINIILTGSPDPSASNITVKLMPLVGENCVYTLMCFKA